VPIRRQGLSSGNRHFGTLIHKISVECFALPAQVVMSMADHDLTRHAALDDSTTVSGLMPGIKVFSRYLLEALAGQGGMGTVWRARDTERDEVVALKFLPEVVARDNGAVAELQEETRQASRLTHPNIVRLHRFEREGAMAAFAMEFVDGATLAHLRMQQPGKVFALDKLAPLVAQLCAALDYAHGREKIVHRNLKLANILVTADGVVRVADFGIARSLNDLLTRLTGRAENTGSTLLSMSPQQLRGDDPAASDDIYALGAILYELLTGRPPFYTGDVAWQIREMAPKSVNSRLAALGMQPVPAGWDETILGCLAKEPESRPQSAGAVAARLNLPDSGPREKLPTVAPQPSLSAAKSREFSIVVDPADAGARVWLGPASNLEVKDGRVVVANLPDGEHELIVQAEGYQLFSARVTVTDGRGSAETRLVAIKSTIEIAARAGTVVTAIDARGHRIELGTVPADGVIRSDNLLMVGRYMLQLTHADCVPVEVHDVELVLGRTIRVAPVQAPLPGELRVFSVPAGAEVRVNGKVAGSTPATIRDQPCGQSLKVEVLQHGYRCMEQVITLKSREVRNVNFGMLTAESGGIELQLKNADLGPASVTFTVDGKTVEPRRQVNGSSTPAAPDTRLVIDGLEVGSRILEVTHPDCEPWKQAVDVRDHENTAVDITLVPLPGTVVCETVPVGARVVINGGDQHDSTFFDDQTETESLTPLRGALAPGTYALRFELKGYKPATRTVTLAANQTVDVSTPLEKLSLAEEGHAWTVPDLDLGMAFIQQGAFTMGSLNGGVDEKPQTQVTLRKGYWLGKTEVTQGQWEALMGTTVTQQRDKANREWALRGEGRAHPIYYVDWHEATEFCRKLTEREREAGRLPEGHAYMLPTEAQWEYACRAGTTEDYAGSLDTMAWFGGDKGGQTHPVAQKQANAWGLFDMHGNVREWCRDWYKDHLPGGSVVSPAGSASGNTRVVRGGSWISLAQDCRSAARFGIAPGVRQGSLGFRVALVAAKHEAPIAALPGRKTENQPQPTGTAEPSPNLAERAVNAPDIASTTHIESPLADDPGAMHGGVKPHGEGLPPAQSVRQEPDRGVSASTIKLYPLLDEEAKLKPRNVVIGAFVLLGIVAAAWWFFGGNSSTPGKIDSDGAKAAAKSAPTPEPAHQQQPNKPLPAAPEKPRGPQQGQTWIVPDLNLDLVYLHPGAFMMGSPYSEKGRFKNESPQTQVTLSKGSWLGKTAVTQGQWETLMAGNPSSLKATDLPVDQISWTDAVEFCRKLTERERAAGRLPDGYVYSLPSEAQWEYACRAGTVGQYGGDGHLDDMGWYSDNSGNTMHPVGQKQANAWGLYDMHGNTWEWCQDRFGDYPGGSVTDPTGTISGSAHVVRGGSCNVPARFCRSAFRRMTESDSRENHLGFRLALRPSP
jgi:formylglycine-generating enzyme required for sulfatase activity/serine/threonine protein kinase